MKFLKFWNIREEIHFGDILEDIQFYKYTMKVFFSKATFPNWPEK